MSVLDTTTHETTKTICFTLEEAMHPVSQDLKIFELADEMNFLLDTKQKKIIVLSAGKHQNSPRQAPPHVTIDGYEFNFSFKDQSLWVDVIHQKQDIHFETALVSQRNTLKKSNSMPVHINERWSVTSSWSYGILSVIDRQTDEIITTIALGPYPLRPVVLANKIYVALFNGGLLKVIEYKKELMRKLN